ncbi:occludin/ELL domain-containing protein 1 [Microcebus murinus]|uniref:occludin/ELL domain-containing protein 1 n=1 Tax=Microcebus murinus TaxID=30608 RepID=UPI003F6A97B0
MQIAAERGARPRAESRPLPGAPPARAPRLPAGPPAARGTRASRRPTPARQRPQTRPPGPGPPQRPAPPGLPRAPRAPRPPQPGARRATPRKIAFEDELPSQTRLSPEKPVRAIPGGHVPARPHPVPDYELKYPAVSSARERRRYAAVFEDQHAEFLELRRDVGRAQAKLRQLEALLCALPAPRSQEEAQVAARVCREFERKRRAPGFLDKQARCHYLKGKLRHLKTQIQKFDDGGGSEGSVYF